MVTRNKSVAHANAMARATLSQGSRSDPDHLGDLSWWDISTGWKMPVDLVRDAFAAHGLDPNGMLPQSPDWVTAFGRAVISLSASLKSGGIELKDAAPGANGERRVAVCKVRRNGIVALDADQGIVACPKDGHAPAYVETPDAEGYTSRLVQMASDGVGVYTVADVRTAVIDTYKRFSGMPCRQSPPHVVYWVPPQAGKTLRALADTVLEIGWGRIELFAGYASDERSKAATVQAVNTGLEARLTELCEKASSYLDPNRKREANKSIENAITEAQALIQDHALYADILGAQVASVKARAERIQADLMAKITGGFSSVAAQ